MKRHDTTTVRPPRANTSNRGASAHPALARERNGSQAVDKEVAKDNARKPEARPAPPKRKKPFVL
jgi:hypothetical protein